MSELVLTTYDWVPDARHAAMFGILGCIGRWRKPVSRTASRAHRSVTGNQCSLCTNQSVGCLG